MHPTLSPFGNLVLALTWAVIAAALVWIYPEFRLTPLVAIGFGVLAGILQARAINANPQAFAAATTMREVRNALIATYTGKAAIFAGWCCAAVVLAITVGCAGPFASPNAPAITRTRPPPGGATEGIARDRMPW